MVKVVNFEYNAQYTSVQSTFNVNNDIVWSFKFALIGDTSSAQGGFTTFLRQQSVGPLSGGAPFAGLGYTGYESVTADQNILTESSFEIISEIDSVPLITDQELVVGNLSGIPGAFLGIAFDTEGLFALSSTTRDGVGVDSIYKNALVIRGGVPDYNLLYNIPLSSLSTNFTLLTTTESYCWLRFRLGDVCSKLYIDYRYGDDSSYISLTSLPLSLTFANNTFVGVGISYASPVTATGVEDATLKIQNLQIEGSTTTPLSTSYTQLTSVGENILITQASNNVATQDEHIILT